MDDLAIIIPAFKEEFFDKALNALASQTNQKFTVYVGDDCSPYNIQGVVDKYVGRLKLKYTRFEQNIGSKNIVQQWKRCIQLSKNEKWLWLFSDDDLVDSNAVENFYSISNDTGERFDVFRFNTLVIDKDDKVTYTCPVGPNEESSEQMAYNLLLGFRGNSMPDHIFSREVYNRYGGFVETEFAQAADWATSILFSQEKGIRIIPNAILYWRQSGTNISSVAKEKSREMLAGHLQFIAWVLNHFSYLKEVQGPVSYEMMKAAAVINLKSVVKNHYKRLDNSNVPNLIWMLHTKLDMSYRQAVRVVYDIKRTTPSRLNAIVDLLKRVVSNK